MALGGLILAECGRPTTASLIHKTVVETTPAAPAVQAHSSFCRLLCVRVCIHVGKCSNKFPCVCLHFCVAERM